MEEAKGGEGGTLFGNFFFVYFLIGAGQYVCIILRLMILYFCKVPEI
jgi:hypothetical protein